MKKNKKVLISIILILILVGIIIGVVLLNDKKSNQKDKNKNNSNSSSNKKEPQEKSYTIISNDKEINFKEELPTDINFYFRLDKDLTNCKLDTSKVNMQVGGYIFDQHMGKLSYNYGGAGIVDDFSQLLEQVDFWVEGDYLVVTTAGKSYTMTRKPGVGVYNEEHYISRGWCGIK